LEVTSEGRGGGGGSGVSASGAGVSSGVLNTTPNTTATTINAPTATAPLAIIVFVFSSISFFIKSKHIIIFALNIMITIPWHMFTYDNTDEFTFNGLKMVGRVVNIHDGDTMNVILPVFDTNLCRFSIRLNGIDTCEIKSKDKVLQDNALKARDRVFELLTNNKVNTKNDIKKLLESEVYLVWVECLNKDKYGRVLANIYKDKGTTKTVSEILLEEKLAYKYEGKTKLSEDNIKEELNI
jgi:endonuclease YncB( thermonuclease family)